MMNFEDKKAIAIRISQDILIQTKSSLMVGLRFLDIALSTLKLSPQTSGKISTDGRSFYYNVSYILNRYKTSREEMARDYLHTVFHCIFYHPFYISSENPKLWSLACDITVENIISEIGLNQTKSTLDRQQAVVIKSITSKVTPLTAEKVYNYLLDEDFTTEKLAQIEGLFKRDDHESWYTPKKIATDLNLEGESDNKDTYLTADSIASLSNNGLPLDEWKKISERVMIDLETKASGWGTDSSSLNQNINRVNREKYSYREFLLKFAELGEVMIINDDEFDYIYYTYGLKLYKRIPLIEPLESKEVKRIREFVVAIDTSGSCSGEVVQSFIQKTYNIFKETETFFSKVNIHIIQCDAEIQSDHKITSNEDFDEYIKKMELSGFGGTDFRPVFSHVEELIRKKEFVNLKGLIYFTDGYGDFPSKKPSFDTAFVFVDSGLEIPEVPSWAIKLVLDDNELVQ